MTSPIIVGIDEAGRGPVLGPLVMVAIAVLEEDLKKLEWLGVKDSKLLSSERREELFEPLRELVHDFRVEVIEPDAIDLSLTEQNTNLNWLEADTAARMISELAPHTAIVDCPSPNIAANRNYLFGKLDVEVQKKISLQVEHKADTRHFVVGAASIVAKVIRDRTIAHLQREVGVDFGSGYMTDPKTKEFLEKYHGKHAYLFRKQWQSYKDALARKEQRRLGEYK